MSYGDYGSEIGRPEIVKIISKMLDNPDEYGIYPTSVTYRELDRLVQKAFEDGFKHCKAGGLV